MDELPTMREIREQNGLARSVVANELGVSLHDLTGWEKMQTLPPVEVRESFCTLFGLAHGDVRWLTRWLIDAGAELVDGMSLQRPIDERTTDHGRTFQVAGGKVLW